ncbi:MAG TPA: LamG-like jellyroll fold domain-containing protein [Terracidiphilus sp.]|nr:LamG-like jellyroll fold domain-containing protein [Terracidiphilus sp.]
MTWTFISLPHRRYGVLLPALFFVAMALPAQVHPRASSPVPQQQMWRFDRLDSIGGYTTHIVGHPQLIETPAGKAIQFNGVDDGIFVEDHPLAWASTYTWEVIFRPDADGAEAQRFFHLQEQDPKTGKDTGNRMLFEIRIVNGQWCLDSFASSGDSTRTLLNCKLLHPLGRWYRVTAVYDGNMLRNYVDDELEGEGPLDLKPQMPGHSSIGVRINKVYWFKGAVLLARMTPRVLKPEELLKMPAGLNAAEK